MKTVWEGSNVSENAKNIFFIKKVKIILTILFFLNIIISCNCFVGR
jgi:preprotein translocase subunit SecG